MLTESNPHNKQNYYNKTMYATNTAVGHVGYNLF